MPIREYGTSGPLVVVLHGGPGAPGYMAPVARGLADRFRVLEPFQRPSGGEALTVARHVEDLRDVVLNGGGVRPALVGHSWGATLALAFAAAHPQLPVALALVGCGTFDHAARARLRATREERIDAGLRRRLEQLPSEIPDADRRLQRLGSLMLPVDSHEPMDTELDLESCDARAYRETWKDMERLQQVGIYPAAFAPIKSPTIMLHGAQDPHPGSLIRASLLPFLPHLEYHEWDRCGHYPWLEKAVREDFFAVLREWLARRFSEEPQGAG